jgi:hypothetical protein
MEAIPTDDTTRQLGADELPQPGPELVVGWTSRECSGGDDDVCIATGRQAAQKISEPLVMVSAPGDLDGLEAAEPVDETGQEAA